MDRLKVNAEHSDNGTEDRNDGVVETVQVNTV